MHSKRPPSTSHERIFLELDRDSRLIPLIAISSISTKQQDSSIRFPRLAEDRESLARVPGGQEKPHPLFYLHCFTIFRDFNPTPVRDTVYTVMRDSNPEPVPFAAVVH